MTPVAIPQSQLEAVQDAVAALKLQLPGTSTSGKQAQKAAGFGSATSHRYAVEIPSADDSPTGAADLAASVFATLVQQLPASPALMPVVFADAAAAEAAVRQGGGWRVLSLQAACRQEKLRGTLLVVVAPQVSDVALVEQLLAEVWVGSAAVVVNPQWAAAPVPAAFSGLVDSISVVYSFLPIAVKGLVGNKEGAVLRSVKSAGSEAIQATPWRILCQTGGQFCQVGQTKARPKAEDLEVAFYNASAASSPLTSMVKFFRSAADRVSGKRQG